MIEETVQHMLETMFKDRTNCNCNGTVVDIRPRSDLSGTSLMDRLEMAAHPIGSEQAIAIMQRHSNYLSDSNP